MLCYLVIHFTSVFLYSKPFISEKTKPEFYAQAYIYPYFHQNWNLFAPVPDANYKLFCAFENNGKKNLDIFSEIKTVHQSNRLKGYGPLLVAFSNSIYYFEKSTKQQSNSNAKRDLGFKIIEKLARNYITHTRQIRVEGLKLILVVDDISTQKQRIYFN